MAEAVSNGQFDPRSHLTDIKGKEYLEVKWRLVWFRQDYPADSGWGISTVGEDVTEQAARYRANIYDPEGRMVATATKTETKGGFADFVEKAETGAIGRALALLGYGTQFCGEELDEGKRIVDGPVGNAGATRPQAAQGGQQQGNGPAATSNAAQEQVVGNVTCPDCGAPMRLRDGKKGKFYGCSTYPKCKGTCDIADAITEGAIAEAVASPNEQDAPPQEPAPPEPQPQRMGGPPSDAPQTPGDLAFYLSEQGNEPASHDNVVNALIKLTQPNHEWVAIDDLDATMCAAVWRRHQDSGAAVDAQPEATPEQDAQPDA